MAAVRVVHYDPEWPKVFESLRSTVWPATCDIAISIEHVGSTSVPDLAAKPIIDMDVIVPTREVVPMAIARLEALGYVHRGDLGIEDREAFEPLDGLPQHHLYLCVEGCLALRNHLALRDSLRNNTAASKAYGNLKMALAERFHDDIDRYVAGKTEFILGVLRQCGFEPDALKAIEAVNRE